jgi:hypothetical protein
VLKREDWISGKSDGLVCMVDSHIKYVRYLKYKLYPSGVGSHS